MMWMEMIRLGDACEILNGFAFKSQNYVDSGIRIIRISNVQKGFIEDNTPAFYPLDSSGLDKYMLNDGDLLISLTGNVGRVAILEKEFLPAALNQRVACIRLKIDKLSKGYLFHILNSDFFEQQCIQSSNGVAQKNMSTEWLKEYKIPVYSKEKQEAITEILDKVRKIITCRNQEIKKMDDLIKARFVEMFGSVREDRFPKCTLRELAHIKHGYAFSGKFFSDEDNGVVLVTPGNFALGGGFQEVKNKYFTANYPNEYVLHPGDLIVTMTDLSKKVDTLGYGAIVPDTEKVYLHNQRIGLFDKIDRRLNPIFMRWYMQTEEYRLEIVRTSTGSTVHHTSPDRILNTVIFIPPIELQDEFEQFANQVDKSKYV